MLRLRALRFVGLSLVAFLAILSGCASEAEVLASRVAEALEGSSQPRGQLLVLPRSRADQDLAREAYWSLKAAGSWCRLSLSDDEDFHGYPLFEFELRVTQLPAGRLEAELREVGSGLVLLAYESP